jgi:hypothetical protein
VFGHIRSPGASVRDTTTFGIAFIASASGPFAADQCPASVSYVARPTTSVSIAFSRSSAKRVTSSPNGVVSQRSSAPGVPLA